MDSLTSLSGFNPLNLLSGGADALQGFDPMAALSSLFGNQAAAQQGQPAGDVCSCGGAASGGACTCGSNCCQQNQDLGF
jgi:hypothetical protein